MGSKKTKTTSNETATTTPNVPPFAQGPITDYYGQVGNFLGGDISDYTTPANPIQQSVFDAGVSYPQKLGNLNSQTNYALGSLTGASQDLSRIDPAKLTSALPPALLPTMDVSSIGPRGYNSAQIADLGNASLAQAANAGNASQVDLRGYDPNTVDLRGYNAATVGDVSQFIDPAANTIQAQSLLDNFSAYQNPYTQNVVDTTLSDYDQYAAQERARQEGITARNRGFSGSGSAIAEAQLGGELARGRAATEAGLRSDAFSAAAGLSNLDTLRRQDALRFNAGSQNERDLARGQLGLQAGLYNADAITGARRYGSDAYNQEQLYNATAGTDASRYFSDVTNQERLRNADASDQFALTNAGFSQETALANAAGQRDFDLQRFLTQTGLNQINTAAANEALAQQYSVEAQKAQQDAAANNSSRQQFFDAQAQANLQNANNATDLSQFNSNLALQQAQQRAANAGQFSDIASQGFSNYQSGLQQQQDIGNALWELQNQNSPLTQMLLSQGLLDPQLLSVLTGQTINSSGTSTGKQSGGLLGSILSAGSKLGSAAIVASERRVKRDIELIDREPDGLGVYRYNYVWDGPDEPTRIGVMADEVATIRSWALGPVMDGIQTVNYGAL